MTSVNLRRSILFVPGANVRMLEKARDLAADVLVFDLEDAVGPEEKELARENVVHAIAGRAYEGRELAVRINAADSPEGLADLEAILPYGPDIIVLPKVEDPELVARICAALDESGAPRGLALWVMIETPKAMLHLADIAATGARRRVSALVAGSNDLAEQLGLPLGRRRWALHPFLMQMVAAARAHSLLAIDGVFNNHGDPDGFAHEAGDARAMGFDGKSLIHPNQIGPCHSAFQPSWEELSFARRVVAAFQIPENLTSGAIAVDGRMVERLHLDAARRVLALAGESEDA